MKRLAAIGVGLVLITAACSGEISRDDYDRVVAERDALAAQIASIDETERLAVAVGDAVEAADAAAAASFFSDEAVYEDVGIGARMEGRNLVQTLFSSFLTTDSPIENTAFFVGPGFAVTEWVWTQPCTFPTCRHRRGETVEIRGITLQVMEGGEIIRNSDYPAFSPDGY